MEIAFSKQKHNKHPLDESRNGSLKPSLWNGAVHAFFSNLELHLRNFPGTYNWYYEPGHEFLQFPYSSYLMKLDFLSRKNTTKNQPQKTNHLTSSD